MTALAPGDRGVEFECPKCGTDFDLDADQAQKPGDVHECSCGWKGPLDGNNARFWRIDEAGVMRFNEGLLP